MAIRKSNDKVALKMKMYALLFFLLVSSGWGYWKFKHTDTASHASSVTAGTGSKSMVNSMSPIEHKSGDKVPVVSVNSIDSRQSFIDKLFNEYHPRLSGAVYHPKKGVIGEIEFYAGERLVERLMISQLRSLGLAVIPKDYGVDVITSAGSYVVTSWPLGSDNIQVEPLGQIANREKTL